MSPARILACLLLTLAPLACRRSEGGIVRLPRDRGPASPGEEPPVAINADGPVEYPQALYEQGIEGTVLLRLFVDEGGKVLPDSTVLAESSGYPALDSAALAAVPKLRFAPARHNGTAVAARFLQPIQFRHPQFGGTTP